ncbi:MAG: YceD family protein [Chloroflexota bacterium]
MMSALRFNVAGLLKEQAGAAREYEIEASPDDLGELVEGAHPADGLRGGVRMMRTPRSVFVRGHLETRVIVECSRCLRDVETPIELEIEAEYFPAIDITTGHPLPAPDDDLAFTIDANHELDLGEAIRQNLLLELPMQRLCSEACQGLCPRCGADLNQGPCACEPEPADERLTPLRALLEGTAKS